MTKPRRENQDTDRIILFPGDVVGAKSMAEAKRRADLADDPAAFLVVPQLSDREKADKEAEREREEASGIKWNEEQRALREWFANKSGNEPKTSVTIARAGTGKSTTATHAIALTPEIKLENGVLICAFSKTAAEDLKVKIDNLYGRDDNVEARTLHSLGLQFVKLFWPQIQIDFSGARSKKLAALAAPKAPDTILRLIAKLCNKGREMTPFAESGRDLEDLAVEFECDPDDEWADYGWNLETVCNAAFKAMQLAKEKPASNEIDFSDMLYLPLANGWVRPKYELVIVDEAQDMNVSQIELARRSCKGRFAVIGDDLQAIFSFRGADSGVLHRIAEQENAKVLKLTATYRCAKAIVRENLQYAPDYVAGENNEEGVVDHLSIDKVLEVAQPGDAILSRVNAPLFPLALNALRLGIPAFVVGKADVASGLRNLARQLAKGQAANSIPQFIAKLTRWEKREVDRAEGLPERLREGKIEAVRDKSEALRSIADGCASVNEIYARIDKLFKSVAAGRAITCSSVHRAKGLEWNRVFVLESTLRRGGSQEERNICYVATTRAKSHLTMVG